MPGPNDFHINRATGIKESGLGPDEPSPEQRLTAAEASAQLKIREEALLAASAEVRNEARSLEDRKGEIARQAAELDARAAHLKDSIASDFDVREADLRRREEEFQAKVAAAASTTTEGRDAALQDLADSGARKVLATERAQAPIE